MTEVAEPTNGFQTARGLNISERVSGTSIEELFFRCLGVFTAGIENRTNLLNQSELSKAQILVRDSNLTVHILSQPTSVRFERWIDRAS